MEPLSMCWMLDKRWFCMINNPIHQYLLMIPVVIDMATLTGIVVERNIAKLDISGWTIVLFAIYGLKIILSLLLMIKISVNVS